MTEVTRSRTATLSPQHGDGDDIGDDGDGDDGDDDDGDGDDGDADEDGADNTDSGEGYYDRFNANANVDDLK